MAKKKKEQRPKQKQHWEEVQELRRSNAAGTHGNDKYNRRTKYKPDYRNNDE